MALVVRGRAIPSPAWSDAVDQAGLVAVEAKVLLALALTQTMDPDEIQELIDWH